MIENLIDGRFQAVHAASIPVLSPSTGEKIADCFETPAAEVERERSFQPEARSRPGNGAPQLNELASCIASRMGYA
jgi:hypothetical protein